MQCFLCDTKAVGMDVVDGVLVCRLDIAEAKRNTVLKCIKCRRITTMPLETSEANLKDYKVLNIKPLNSKGRFHFMNDCIQCKREREGRIEKPRNKATFFPLDNGKGGGFW